MTTKLFGGCMCVCVWLIFITHVFLRELVNIMYYYTNEACLGRCLWGLSSLGLLPYFDSVSLFHLKAFCSLIFR